MKTKTPLQILVTDPAMLEWPEVKEIMAKGHMVSCLAGESDVVIGPNCWQMTEALRKYFKLAIAAAKTRAKGKP